MNTERIERFNQKPLRLEPERVANPKIPEAESLKRYALISLGLHFAVLIVLTVRAFFLPSEPIFLERAVRVDIVGLPDKVRELPQDVKKSIQETAKAEAEPPPEPAKPPQEPAKPAPTKEAPKVALPNKPKAPDLSQSKAAQSSALKRIEALKRLEAESKAAERRELGEKLAATQSNLIKGNEVSPGSSLTGIAKIENDEYLNDLDKHVKKHWDLPNFLARANLRASVLIHLDERGFVVKKEMTRSSGNQIFDQTVLASIERASPFPQPPKRLVNLFMVEGIVLGFPD